ncbi:signal peptidase I [Demequina silvatica]|uniref:signal peptidase I n=1 Tax=Demequina silvatica TaxID=1638988 RepID=UPI0007818BC7|nr:signal peptidase I [Demequina silvatica]
MRAVGGAGLWVGAVVGVLLGLVWLATALGLIRPLIVVSGSMEPAIAAGDLIIDRPIRASELEVGDIATLPSSDGTSLVTHRVVWIDPVGEDRLVGMQGDANASADQEPYVAQGDVLVLALTVPGAGAVLEAVSRPVVLIPIGLVLLACAGMYLMRDPDDEDGADEPALAATRPERAGG